MGRSLNVRVGGQTQQVDAPWLVKYIAGRISGRTEKDVQGMVDRGALACAGAAKDLHVSEQLLRTFLAQNKYWQLG